ncbi:MAG TPA: hypothetical protein VNA20_04740 [Frankiaceae bacterium]|nr:hypothetical protein [Frankiaceae bacterium]
MSMSRGRLGVAAAAVTVVAVGSVVMVTSAAVGDIACSDHVAPRLGKALRTVSAPHAGGRETTRFHAGGAYHVARCDADGRLVESQTVAPIAVPGGSALLPVNVVSRQPDGGYRVVAPTYANPADPAFVRAWRTGRDAILASTFAPTEVAR